MSVRLLGAKQRFNKERIQLVENLQIARCSPFVILKCSPLAWGNWSLLVLAKINALFACSQMLAKTIRYPYNSRCIVHRCKVKVHKMLSAVLSQPRDTCEIVLCFDASFSKSVWQPFRFKSKAAKETKLVMHSPASSDFVLLPCRTINRPKYKLQFGSTVAR